MPIRTQPGMTFPQAPKPQHNPNGRQVLVVLGLFFLAEMALAQESYYFWDFTTDANISRAIGINISDGNASLSRRRPMPNISITNTSNATCGGETMFFAEFNSTGIPNASNITWACMAGHNKNHSNLSSGGSNPGPTIENWRFENGLFGQAIRVTSNTTSGGRICYNASDIWWRDQGNDQQVILRLKFYNWTNNGTLVNFKNSWSIDTVSHNLLFFLTKAPNGTTYNKEFNLGVESRLADNSWHEFQIIKTNTTGITEIFVFLDGDLRVYTQNDRLTQDPSGGQQNICFGDPDWDISFDEIIIRNLSNGSTNHVNLNYSYYEVNHSYSLMGGMLVLDNITIPTGTDIHINATYIYNNTNSSRLYVTGFYNNNSQSTKFIQNTTISFSEDTCGDESGTNETFFNDGHPFFDAANITYTCDVSSSTANWTVVDAIANGTNGSPPMDVGVETNYSDLAADRWIRNIVRGYGGFSFTAYYGADEENDIEAAARWGLINLDTANNIRSLNTFFMRPIMRSRNCGSNPLTCFKAEVALAKNWTAWSIVASHYDNAITSTTYDEFINYTTINQKAMMMSVRDAQQLWFPEINSSGIIIPSNRTNANFTPVILFFGDGNTTPILQSLNISWTSTTDTTPPSYTSFVNRTTSDAIALNFSTGESANASITYGLSPTFLPSRVNWSYTTNTSFYFNITGLAGNLNYYYNVTVCDANNNCNISALNTTTTPNNNLPVISQVAINQDPLQKNSTANCSWTYSDADSDPQGTDQIIWYVNTTIAQTQNWTNGSSNVSLSPTFFNKGDTVYCSVWGNDTKNMSTNWANGSKQVSNANPTITSLTLTPTTPTKTSSLLCTATGNDLDGDTITQYYDWYDSDNTTLLQTGSNQTFDCGSSSSCARTDNITCQATLEDSGGTNSTASDLTRTVNNTAPTAAAVNIHPPQPNSSTSGLNCSYAYSDLDSDSVNATYYRWYRNDTALKTGNFTNFTLDAGDGINFNGTDIYVCEALPQDHNTNGTATNSSSVIIGNPNPAVNSTSAPTKTDVGTNITLNWTWTTASTNPHSHAVCNSSIGAGSICAGETYCSLEDNSSPSSCNFTANRTLSTTQTAYLLIRAGGGENSTWATMPLTVNHAPNSSNISMNVNSTNSINTYNCTLTGTNDSDTDATTLYYSFYQSNGSILQSESTSSTFSAGSGIATHGDSIQCRARAHDGRLYGPSLNTSNHSRIGAPSFTVGAVDTTTTVTFPITNTSGVINATLQLRDPLNVVYSNLNMSYSSGTTWTYSFAPNQVGTWTVTQAAVVEQSNASYTFLGSGDTFTVSTASTATGGGSSDKQPYLLPPTPLPPPTPITKDECPGDGCTGSENFWNCPEDCSLTRYNTFGCLPLLNRLDAFKPKDPVQCGGSFAWVPGAVTAGLLLGFTGMTTLLLGKETKVRRQLRRQPTL